MAENKKNSLKKKKTKMQLIFKNSRIQKKIFQYLIKITELKK